MPKDLTFVRRFSKFIQLNHPSRRPMGYWEVQRDNTIGECWQWENSFNGSGVPVLRLAGKLMPVVRALAQSVPDINPDLNTGHRVRCYRTCNEMRCVNPAHYSNAKPST